MAINIADTREFSDKVGLLGLLCGLLKAKSVKAGIIILGSVINLRQMRKKRNRSREKAQKERMGR